MRVARGRLIFMALCAVDEAIEQLGNDPVRPTVALRLAVAFLFAVSDGRRGPYDSFWKVLRDPYDWAHSAENRAYMRRTNAQTQAYGICRSVGIEPTAKFLHSLAAARDPERRQRMRMAEAVKRVAAERAEIGEKARKARECDLSG